MFASCAEAAAAAPPESAEQAFDRWTADALAENGARPTPLATGATPSALPPPVDAPASQADLETADTLPPPLATPEEPALPRQRFANYTRKRGRPPVDPLEQLVWFTKPYPHAVEAKRKQITLARKLGKAKEAVNCVTMTVLKNGHYRVKDIESGIVVGDFDDAQIAVWTGLEHRNEVQSRENWRASYPAECELIQSRGGGEWAETIAAKELSLISKTRFTKVFADLKRCCSRLDEFREADGSALCDEVVSVAKRLSQAIDRDILGLLDTGQMSEGIARDGARTARDAAKTILAEVESLRPKTRDTVIGRALIIERLADRLEECGPVGTEAAKTSEDTPEKAPAQKKVAKGPVKAG